MIGRICIILGTLYCLNSAHHAPQDQPAKTPSIHNPLPALAQNFCTDETALCGLLAGQIASHAFEEGKNIVSTRLSALASPLITTSSTLIPIRDAPLPPRRDTGLDREALKRLILRSM